MRRARAPVPAAGDLAFEPIRIEPRPLARGQGIQHCPGMYEVYASSDGITIDSSPFASGTINATVISLSQRIVRAVIKQLGTSNSAHH
jgi:hypothetical protein